MNKIFTLLCASLLCVQTTLPGGDPFDVLQKMTDQAGKTELKFYRGMPRETFNSQFKLLAIYYHPDKPTGSSELMTQLNDAHDKAIATFGPEPAPKKELTPEQQKAAALINAATISMKEAIAAIKTNDFATAANRYQDASQQFENMAKSGAPKYQDAAIFLTKIVNAVKQLPDVQKKISDIANDLESGKLTPSADVVGKGFMPTFIKDSGSQKTESAISNLLKQLEDSKKELTLEVPKVFTSFKIIIFDKLIDGLTAIQRAFATEKAGEDNLRRPTLVDARLFLHAKEQYDTLHFVHCAQRMAERAAYAQALQAENTAIEVDTSWQGFATDSEKKYKRYIDDKGKSWELAAAAWKEAAKLTSDPQLQFAYEQRAIDIANPTMREKFIHRMYKMKEPPVSK